MFSSPVVRMSTRGVSLLGLPHKVSCHQGVILVDVLLCISSTNVLGGFQLKGPENFVDVVPFCIDSTTLDSFRLGIYKALALNRATYSRKVSSLFCFIVLR